MGKASRRKKERKPNRDAALARFEAAAVSTLNQSSWLPYVATHNCRPILCSGIHERRTPEPSCCYPMRAFVCRCGREWVVSDRGWQPK